MKLFFIFLFLIFGFAATEDGNSTSIASSTTSTPLTTAAFVNSTTLKTTIPSTDSPTTAFPVSTASTSIHSDSTTSKISAVTTPSTNTISLTTVVNPTSVPTTTTSASTTPSSMTTTTQASKVELTTELNSTKPQIPSTTPATTVTTTSEISTTTPVTTTSTQPPSTTTTTTPTTTTAQTTTPSTTTTTTTRPATTRRTTTTTTAAPTTTAPIDIYDYHVCKNQKTALDCQCLGEKLECKPVTRQEFSHSSYYTYYYDYFTTPFKSVNVEIMNQNFTAKSVNFFDNSIQILRKGKVIAGHESTIETLLLASNKIVEIENGTFDSFTALRNLSLSTNRLTNLTTAILSEELGRNVIRLDLSYNYFKNGNSINLVNMVKLEKLSLQGNYFFESLIEFPEALQNLKILNLRHCSLRNLSENTFENLINLESLDMVHNMYLTSFPVALKSLQTLQFLDLSNTGIPILNFTHFETFENLETLYMTASSLKLIDDCTFCNATSLKNLYLWKNEELSYINENAFGYAYNGTAPSLERLSLEFCNLTVIPENLLEWETLKGFGFDGNPFFCNCSMAWLINDILSPTHTINMQALASDTWLHYKLNNKLACSGPHALKNVPFHNLSQKFCPNHIPAGKKGTPAPMVLEQPPSSPVVIPWFCAVAIAILAFGFGIFVIPFGRFLLGIKKSKDVSILQKADYETDTNPEDFDNPNFDA